MRILWLVTIGIATFTSCKSNTKLSNHIIKIDINESPELDKLPKVELLSIVPLESADSMLIGQFFAIEYVDDKIYVLDAFKSRAVFAFSNEGKFSGKTKIGKAPGELESPFAFYIDKKSKEIYIWDQVLLAMQIFDLNLQHLRKEPFPIPLLTFAKLPADRTLVHSHYDQDYTYKVYSPEQLIEQEFIPDYDYSGSIGLFRTISTSNRQLLITPYQYHVYNLNKEMKLNSEYFFDFGRKRITREDVEIGGIEEIIALQEEGSRVSSLHNISESNSLLSFHVYYRSEAMYYVHLTKDGSTFQLNPYFENNILPKCDIKGLLENDIFYATVEPQDLENFQNIAKQEVFDSTIIMTDNPYIMTFRLQKN